MTNYINMIVTILFRIENYDDDDSENKNDKEDARCLFCQ